MNTLWEKIVFWTKATIFGLVALYALAFIAANWGVDVQDIHLIFAAYTNVPLEKVLLFDSVLSIVAWWLFWAIYRTIRRFQAAATASSAAAASATSPSITSTTTSPATSTTLSSTTTAAGSNSPPAPSK
jgi:hypothetical protein